MNQIWVKTRHLLAAASVVPLGLIIGSVWVSERSDRALTTSLEWVEHTGGVIDRLTEISRFSWQLESELQGALLFGNTDALNSPARGKLGDEARVLHTLVADNKTQLSHADEIWRLTREQLNSESRILTLNQTGRQQEAIALFKAPQRAQFLAGIQSQVRTMKAIEDGLLVERKTALTTAIARDKVVGYGVISCQVLLIGVIAYLAWRLGKLENFAIVCAWSRTVEYEGAWLSYEEYLHRRFRIKVSHGISPAEAAKLYQQLPPE